LFLFCLFWQAFLFFGKAAHHGFVFGYSQRPSDGIFGGGKHFFLGSAMEDFCGECFCSKVIANKSSIYLRKPE